MTGHRGCTLDNVLDHRIATATGPALLQRTLAGRAGAAGCDGRVAGNVKTRGRISRFSLLPGSLGVRARGFAAQPPGA